jgi:hypothetical protein
MIVIKKFNGELPVSFDPFMQEKECMVNATEMGKVFGKLVKDYLKSEKTKEFLKVLEIELGNSKMGVEKGQYLDIQKDVRPFETEKTDAKTDENLEVQKDNSPFENGKTEAKTDENLEVQNGNSPFENDVKFSENILKVVKGGRNSGTWVHRYLALDFAMWLDPYFNYWVISTIDEILFGHARKRDLSFKRTLEIKERMKCLREKENPTGEDFTEYLQLDTEQKQEQNNRTQLTTSRIGEIQILIFTDNEMAGK